MATAPVEQLRTPEEASDTQLVYVALERDILLERPPEDVWPFLLDYCAWQGYSRRETVFGERDEIGELVILQKQERGLEGFPPYYARTLDIVPGRRVLWKTFPATGGDYGDFFGFVDFHIAADGGGTRFSAVMTYEFQLRDQSAEALTAFRHGTTAQFETLLDDVLPKLKAAVEGR